MDVGSVRLLHSSNYWPLKQIYAIFSALAHVKALTVDSVVSNLAYARAYIEFMTFESEACETIAPAYTDLMVFEVNGLESHCKPFDYKDNQKRILSAELATKEFFSAAPSCFGYDWCIYFDPTNNKLHLQNLNNSVPVEFTEEGLCVASFGLE